MAGLSNFPDLMSTRQRLEQQQQRRRKYDADDEQEEDIEDDMLEVYRSGGELYPKDMLTDLRQQMHSVDDDTLPYRLGGGAYGTGNDPFLHYVSSGGDLSLPQKAEYYDSDEEISIRKYLGIGVQWISLLTENLLCHPFIVLRRQCQVYHASQRYHLHPFQLLPTIVHLQRRQGIGAFWKGLGSCLLVRGTSLAVEDMLSKITGWPKQLDSRLTLKRFGKHVLLKSLSIAFVMPFYAASLVETVQSDIASEKPGMFDVFREGSMRLLYWKYPQKGRMLPIWALIGPAVGLGISKYLFSLLIKSISTRIVRRRFQQLQIEKGARFKDDTLDNQNVEVYANLTSMLLTEMLFFPFETILHRIQLQGTRTIIDNLDKGISVVPVLTNYQGAFDCYRTTIITEGVSGLYKGFGAMILQFAAHIAVIRLTKWAVGQLADILVNRPPNNVIQFYNLNRRPASNSTSVSSLSDLDVPSIGPSSVD